MDSKIIKIIGILFVVLILLIIGISVFTRTDYFRSTVKNLMEKSVSNATGQRFTVGKIEGDLIRGLILKDVSLKIEGESFMHLDEFAVRYSLSSILDSSVLFSRVIPLKGISFGGLSINLIRDEYGNLNVSKLKGETKEERSKEEEKNKGEPSKWTVFIESLSFKDAKITFEDRGKKEVSNIEIPDIDLSLRMFGINRKIDLNLKKADIYTSPQQINVKGASGKVVYTPDKTQIKDLEANVNGSKIKFDGELSDSKEHKFKFKAAAYGFSMEKGVLNTEVQGSGEYNSPEDIHAEMGIKLLDSQIMGKKVWGSIEKIKMAGTNVEIQNGVVKTEFGETSFKGNADLYRILKKEGVNKFNLKVFLKNIDLSKIPELTKIQPNIGIANGDFNIDGGWREIGDLEVKVNVNQLRQRGNLGEVNLKGLIEATKSNAKFDLSSNLSKVNLSPVLKDKRYESNLNFNLRLKGSAPLSGKIEGLAATVKGEILPSTVSGINLTRGDINASYTSKTLTLESFSLISDPLKLKTQGTLREEKKMDFGYEINVNDLSFVSKFSPGLDLKGSLKTTGRIQGDIKSPKATFLATVSDFGYKDIQIGLTNLNGDAVANLENPQFQVKGNLSRIQFQKRTIESIDLRAKSGGKGLRGNFSILEDPQRSYEIALRLADLKSQERNIKLDKLKLNLENRTLQNKDVIDLTVSPQKAVVKSFNLYYKDNFILGNASVDFNGPMNVSLGLKRINLVDISQALGFTTPIRGIASGSINLQGTVEEPNIRASLNTANLGSMEFRSDKTTLNLSYLNKKLSLDLDVTENARQILLASGRADVDLNFKKIGENLKDATFDFTIRSTGIDLSPFASLNKEIKEIHGKIILDLRASGSIKSPKANGQVRLQDVSLKTQSLKDEIRVKTGLIEMEGEKGFLRTLEIQTDGGRGTFEGDFDLRKLSYNLSGKMDSFEVKLKEVEAKLDGNVGIKGSDGKNYVSGNIRITRASIRIPEKPTKQVEDIKFVDERKEGPGQFVIGETKETNYFKDNVGMNLNVSIPGNTWARGKGANIEVKGRIGITKKYGEPMILMGNIYTIRGTYEVLGKLFRIVEDSRVSFLGTSEINPFLDVKASYRVSNVTVFVNVSGTADKPVIKLSSDPPMEQTDIISYLTFGTSSDKIGAGERVNLQAKAAQVVGLMAAGQLKGIVGEKLALDVVSVRSGERGPEVEVGKYVTDKLYIAYERSPADTVSTPYSSTTASNLTNKVRAEYRLFDFLTLESTVGQDNPGGDVFFSFDY